MKAYVIKNKEGKYLSTSFDYEGKPLLTDDIVDAMPYDDFDIQMFKCPKDCEVVEITIAEGDLEHQLAQYKNFMEENEWSSIDEMRDTLNKCEEKYKEQCNQLAEKELEAIRWEEHFNNAKMEYQCLEEDKNKEIAELRERLTEKDKEIANIRHQVCQEIRNAFKKQFRDGICGGRFEQVVPIDCFNSILDQIEKGESK